MVGRTPDIDHFTSATPWTLAVHEAFFGYTELVVREGTAGFVAFLRATSDHGSVFANTDQMWHFNCALASSTPGSLLQEMTSWLIDEAAGLVVLSGVPAPLTEPWSALTRWVRPDPVDTSERLIIDLDGDADAWLERRSRKFRANLRNAERRALEAEVVIEARHSLAGDDILDLVLSVEAQSWKADTGSGLNSPDMARFYHRLMSYLDVEQRRLWVAVCNEVPVGYVLGAVAGSNYRGLQQSFVADRARDGIGAALAATQLRDLAADGVRTVDMGMPMAYKQRWADRTWMTQTLVIQDL